MNEECVRESFFIAAGYKLACLEYYGNNFEVGYRWYGPDGFENYKLPPVEGNQGAFDKFVVPEMGKKGLASFVDGRYAGWADKKGQRRYWVGSGFDDTKPILYKLVKAAVAIMIEDQMGVEVYQ